MGNSCINLSSQSFKDLVQESGKDPIELAADINIWADKNPSIDTWPTVKELYEKNQNEDTQYSKLTQEEKARTIEEVTKQHRSITALKDLSAKLAWRIGGKVEFVNRTDVDWKGSNQGMSSVLNEAYMTPDMPFHEIMAHPIIRAIKRQDLKDSKMYAHSANEIEFTLNSNKYDLEKGEYFKNGKEITKEEYIKSFKEVEINDNRVSQLYQNLLKELKAGRGKEVFEQVKRDYKYKYLPEKTDSDYGNYKIKVSESGAKYFDTLEEANKALEEYAGIKYTLEEQQEEAIVTLLSLYAADKIDKVKDKKLWGYLKDLWDEMSDYVKSLLKQDSIEIDRLLITTTLNDLADIMAYGNNKIILPGYKVEYQTPLGNKYDSLEEVNNEIKGLAASNVKVDLSSVNFNQRKQVTNSNEIPVKEFIDEFANDTYIKKGDKWFDKDSNKEANQDLIVMAWNSNISDNNKNKTGLEGFIEKNKEYEQSKEIIEQWKKENNIVYDPQEVYSRGQGFYSSIGAYSNLELDLLFQNLLQHIEDNKKAGGEFTISAFTKPIDSRLKHIEGTEGKVRFKIFPQSQDIKWAAPTDVYSGSVWDAHEKVSKDKKSELLGVSFTKAPSLNNVNQVSPNLADIIDNLSHAHNELGIELTPTNFRIEYDSDLPYESKKLIDNINKILDNKYGKMQVSVIERQNIESTIFKEISELELLKKEDWAAPDHIDLFSKKDEERLEYLKNFIKTGKQPTKTKDNTSSIESVKKKLGITKSNLDRKKFLKDEIDSLKTAIVKKSEKDKNPYKEYDRVVIEEEYFAYEKNGEYFVQDMSDQYGESEPISKELFEDKIKKFGDSKQVKVEDDYYLEVPERIYFSDRFETKKEAEDYIKNALEKYTKELEELNREKEYTSQALTNLKIAKLKEVARKYPRSLITSKVVAIDKNLIDNNDEIQYSKVNQSNNNNNLTVNSKKTVDNNVKSKDLSNSLNKAIESLGIKIETVEYLKNKEGQIDKTLTAEAKIVKTVESIQKVISFVNGKESFEILSEEVAHIFTGLLGFNHPLYQSLEKQIVKYPEYEQVKKDYPELTNEKDIKFEAIGQLIGNNIVELAQKKSKNSLLQNIWDAIIRFLQKSGIAKPNEFQQIALNLLNDNLNQYKLQEIEQENQIIANAKKKQPRKFTRLDWQDEAKQSREYWEKKAKKEKKYSKKIPLQNALSLNSENDNNAVKNKPENQRVNWQQFKKVTPKFTTDISLNPESIKQIKDVLSDTMPDFFYLDAADLQWMAEKCADGTFKLTCQI